MKLIECYVERFGNLEKKHFGFTDGLNCIIGDNGTGKTTLSVFIKVMLYGIGDTKRASLEENDRKHYLPWDGGVAGGSLTFSHKGKTYRVERSFAKKASDDKFIVYDTDTGKPSSDFGENLGEELFGIDCDGFERTVFLSERALTPKSSNKSISAKLSDLVGCDGDIGEMDDALKSLEERRKIYYKKGGSGKIADIKSKISTYKAELERLSEIEKLLIDEEKKRHTVADELSRKREIARQLDKERQNIILNSAKQEQKKIIDEKKKELSQRIKQRSELLSKLGGTPPDFEEITEAEYKLTEASNLTNAQPTTPQKEEYSRLSNYFKGKTNSDEIAIIKDCVEKKKASKEKENSFEYKRISSLFQKRIPEKAEIDKLISRYYEVNRRKKSYGFYITASLFAVLGLMLAILVNPAFLIMTAISAVCIAILYTVKGNKEKNAKLSLKNEVLKFLSSVNDLPVVNDGEIITVLKDMQNSIDRAKDLLKDEEQSLASKLLLDFASKFELRGNDTLVSIEETVKEYDRFTALSLAESYLEGEFADRQRRAKILTEEAFSFISRFKTESNNPLSEIRGMLNEYLRLDSEVASREKELTEFVQRLSDKSDNNSSLPEMSEEEIQSLIAKNDAEITRLSNELVLSERKCRSYSEELDTREDLTLSLGEQEELLQRSSENYETILLTKKYLELSRDAMTSKYLGKTKSNFEQYTAMISGIDDERFEMDTDFGVSKFDCGLTRSLDTYSRGTKDLYNLSARLALVDSLYDDQASFIILDDPFVSFDDKKIQKAKELLRQIEKTRQIIYFTCSDSRAM